MRYALTIACFGKKGVKFSVLFKIFRKLRKNLKKCGKIGIILKPDRLQKEIIFENNPLF